MGPPEDELYVLSFGGNPTRGKIGEQEEYTSNPFPTMWNLAVDKCVHQVPKNKSADIIADGETSRNNRLAQNSGT